MRTVIDGHDVEQKQVTGRWDNPRYFWQCYTCNTDGFFCDTEDESMAAAATHAVKKMTDAKNSERA